MADLTAIKGRQQQAWALGDYAMVGGRILLVSELLCEAVDLRAGQQVLDVATGHGNTALAAARRGCEVIGTDYVPAWLELGRARAAAERLPVTFQEGDAEHLPFLEASFDIVLSTFGVMFAPDQTQAACELLRVCRPGGKIGLANWTPTEFGGAFFRTIAMHVPPPSGVQSPLRWGTEEGVRALFGEHVASLQITRRQFVHRYRSVQEFVDYFRTHFGPLVTAFAALNPEGQARLAQDLVEAAQGFNRSGDATMAAPMDYLEIVATKR
jgi:ubiquinone/menaquinone biosynthesis C-methylase UbiE